MTCESEAESKAGELFVVQSVNDRDQNLLGPLLVVFVVADEVRSHIVGEVIGVDVNRERGAEPEAAAR